MATTQVNLYEAKTHLSSLLERAAKGEEIIIAKAGKPMARLAPLVVREEGTKKYREIGKNILGVTFLSNDWEDDIPLAYFDNHEEEPPSGMAPAAADTK